jgi:Tat protein secretion system quality control protein TatD with DNase activity
MKIFDAHCHLPDKNQLYDLDVKGRNIIFNTFAEYNAGIDLVKDNEFISLIFDFKFNFEKIKLIHDENLISALKIHNRILRLSDEDTSELIFALKKLDPKVPIIIDAFYYGPDLKYQASLAQIIIIAKEFTEIPIIVAHCGGHKVLEYFYHLRPLQNIYYDLSFSMVYLEDTSAFKDLVQLIRFTDKKKILFGTDFPFVKPSKQYEVFKKICRLAKLDSIDIENILYNNAINIFK